jgi:hypothetical protein
VFKRMNRSPRPLQTHKKILTRNLSATSRHGPPIRYAFTRQFFKPDLINMKR